LPSDKREQILIVDPLLAIREFGESMVSRVQFFAIQRVTQFFVSQRQGVPPRMLTKYKFIGWHAHGFRRHDFVAQWITDHPVLMDAGFVRKRVAPNDGFIWLHTKPN